MSDTGLKLRRVVVLGANGYVGRQLMRGLAHNGKVTPVAVSRVNAQLDGCELLQGNATDADFLAQAIRDADVLINLVSGHEDSISQSAEAILSALNQQRQTGKPLLIHFSSMAVYGDTEGVISETTPLAEGLDGYARGKVNAEKILSTWPRHVIFRPGCIVGPDSPQWSSRILAFLKKRRIGDLGPDGDGWSNIIDVQDVVKVVEAVIDHSEAAESGVYNLAMPDAPTWNDYFIGLGMAVDATPVRRIRSGQLKLDALLLGIPLKIMEKIAPRVNASVLRSWPALTPSLLRLWRRRLKLDGTRLEASYPIAWTPLEEVLYRSAGVDAKKDA